MPTISAQNAINWHPLAAAAKNSLWKLSPRAFDPKTAAAAAPGKVGPPTQVAFFRELGIIFAVPGIPDQKLFYAAAGNNFSQLYAFSHRGCWLSLMILFERVPFFLKPSSRRTTVSTAPIKAGQGSSSDANYRRRFTCLQQAADCIPVLGSVARAPLRCEEVGALKWQVRLRSMLWKFPSEFQQKLKFPFRESWQHCREIKITVLKH